MLPKFKLRLIHMRTGAVSWYKDGQVFERFEDAQAKLKALADDPMYAGYAVSIAWPDEWPAKSPEPDPASGG